MHYQHAILIVFSCALTVSCHLCLINPHQRGSMSGLNKVASDDCILLASPCGGRSPQTSGVLKLKAESNYTVIFQKNLDHFSANSPGYFSVSFGLDDMASSFKEVARVSDMGEPSLHLYSVDVKLPMLSGHPNRIIQVSYVTENKEAPAAFYQCADIVLY
ncbi:hypothetical protein EB796_023940 [Bugula neritina]|uniref:Uncharacterized protein n=1 Tax=Bugula neritina TaxID=10212 RepID=A0A7J7IUZ4_BUGNE|nr:hypothetical protein EB796_023940 [Bugula neritina]